MRAVERVRRRLGVRLRSALAAGLVVAVASVLAGVVLLFTARGILMDNVNTAANVRVTQVAAALREGDAEELTAASPRSLVQVLDAAGQVIAGSNVVAERGTAIMSATASRQRW